MKRIILALFMTIAVLLGPAAMVASAQYGPIMLLSSVCVDSGSDTLDDVVEVSLEVENIRNSDLPPDVEAPADAGPNDLYSGDIFIPVDLVDIETGEVVTPNVLEMNVSLTDGVGTVAESFSLTPALRTLIDGDPSLRLSAVWNGEDTSVNPLSSVNIDNCTEVVDRQPITPVTTTTTTTPPSSPPSILPRTGVETMQLLGGSVLAFIIAGSVWKFGHRNEHEEEDI